MLLFSGKACLIAFLLSSYTLQADGKIRKLSSGVFRNAELSGASVMMPLQEVEKELARVKRQNSGGSGNNPVVHGDHQFSDGNNYASIHYSGSSSPVILVLTFRFSRVIGFLGNSNLYRSTDYGASFLAIEDQLDSTQNNPSLWMDFDVSTVHRNQVILYSATQPRFYWSSDEGATWSTRVLSPSTINPTSFVWNPLNDQMALAHDSQNNKLYVTQNLGQSWIKIADFVASPSDYQWGDAQYDQDISVVYFNTYDSSDLNRNNFTVSLLTQRAPYTRSTLHEFDPNLGRHDAFLLLGPYIFAQKTDSDNMINLYVSFNRQPFQKAKIPTTEPHQNYIVSHIDWQQAMVIVEHSSGQYNLYLSDITGVYFSLSLPDIVVEANSGTDLELIEGVNGTLVANQYVHRSSTERTARTLISLDNGGNWELVRSPASVNCVPPQCSLHLHMTTSEYARTGVYSQASAPGLILAHGNTGSVLNADSPDLYISRDGGVTWFQTLQGSWGVTVADHGGLLVAARDYHNTPSRILRYSCDEGLNWTDFQFSATGMTIFGVVTEPGEHTTTVSLYGLKQGTSTWDVVTVNFSAIFPSICSPSNYYLWHPWDDRTDEDCILGSSVTIQRRNASICCLIGQDYSRPISVSICPCFDDDFECDYGYMRSDGFTGPCVRDSSIPLPPPPCLNGSVTESRGYRKVSGDVCVRGVETFFVPVTRTCCANNTADLCQSQCVPGRSICQLSSNGYACQCEPGYSKDSNQPFAPCVDVDECSRSISPCSLQATCHNTEGSFQCSCNAGYVGDGTQCYNINECLADSSPCDTNATCTDTPGSYECRCMPGWSGDGLASPIGQGCHDVNECTLSPAPCDVNSQCTNTVGSFLCTCRQGFLGNGIFCYNCDNPCTNSCDSQAECIYGAGGYQCVCGHGLIGNGSLGYCNIPQNGCDVTSPCVGDAVCSVVQNQYFCQCKPGYTGNGFINGSKCTNVNECDSQSCVSSATCYDTDGSFFCTCSSGFLGDGIASGSGCEVASPAAQRSTNAPIVAALIAVSILFVLAMAGIIVLGIITCKIYSLKHGHTQNVGSIRYRNTSSEEQPVRWNNPLEDQDDDDEPLLT